MKLTITAIVWDTYAKDLREAEKDSDVKFLIFTRHDFDTDAQAFSKAKKYVADSDLVLLYHSAQPYWIELDEYIRGLKSDKKIVSVGAEAMDFELTSVEPRIALASYTYMTNGGAENIRRMIDLFRKELFGEDREILPPVDVPWDGIVHPGAPGRFGSLDEYLSWYPSRENAPWIGIFMSRASYVSDSAKLEFEIVRALEKRGANVILMYSMSRRSGGGAISIGEAAEKYMARSGRPVVDAVIKVTSFMIGNTGDESARDFLKRWDVPVFQPIVTSTMSREQFEESPGITNDISWCVALPELEGTIEPILLGFNRNSDNEDRNKVWEPDRIERLADRVLSRVNLRCKPNREKKVVFLLNNFPCAGAEANIGAAVGLDTHESMKNILAAMKNSGYDVEIPESGKDLIRNILDHKAMSDFRWTTKEDIKSCGGVIRYITAEEYGEYFRSLPEKVRNNMIETWGEPPGESMADGDRIMVTGVQYGNAIIGVQPKRGCFGSKCDGTCCRILHDPLCPPTHQYLATYHYYEEMWGADAVIHVGTHGNLEFLPGKSVGLTRECYPDIAIGRKPHIYVYNADNPPEGTIAKRRSYATLIDHMQAVMTGSGLYSGLEELDRILDEYGSARGDPSRAHQFRHLLADAAEKARMNNLNFGEDTPTEEMVHRCHEELSRIRNSQINLGLHVFGEIPRGEKRAEIINSILRYDAGNGSVRDTVAECHGVSMKDLYSDQGKYIEHMDMYSGRVIEMIGREARDVILGTLDGKDILLAAKDAGL
ncbi:MAG: cobaltochelatase subunit CobN, partial [Candidatus Methanomethylophilaceae archaeon]|nr:cobaltochelatase subunit CobN [Candidatus Methanomethylophilaceae archaeon]